MTRSKRDKKGSTGLWIFLCALILVYTAGAGGSFFLLKDKFAFDSSFMAEIESSREIHSDNGSDSTGRLYGDHEKPPVSESGEVLRKDTLLVVAEDIIRKYMEPYKVKLLDLYMDREGIIYVDFSDEFKVGFKVDLYEELQMISGLFTSIQSSIPGFTALKILIDGQEADSMGGHVDISRPIGEDIAAAS
jgi:hypothetical protein